MLASPVRDFIRKYFAGSIAAICKHNSWPERMLTIVGHAALLTQAHDFAMKHILLSEQHGLAHFDTPNGPKDPIITMIPQQNPRSRQAMWQSSMCKRLAERQTTLWMEQMNAMMAMQQMNPMMAMQMNPMMAMQQMQMNQMMAMQQEQDWSDDEVEIFGLAHEA